MSFYKSDARHFDAVNKFSQFLSTSKIYGAPISLSLMKTGKLARMAGLIRKHIFLRSNTNYKQLSPISENVEDRIVLRFEVTLVSSAPRTVPSQRFLRSVAILLLILKREATVAGLVPHLIIITTCACTDREMYSPTMRIIVAELTK